MIPTIGRIVTVLGFDSNGAFEHPAVITRCWGGDRDTSQGQVLVNLTIWPDLAPAIVAGSVPLFETRDEAQAWRFGQPGPMVAFWPERAGA